MGEPRYEPFTAAEIEAAKAVFLPKLIGSSVELRKAPGGAGGLLGKCPFHEDSTPSFWVFPDHFHCYGCSAHGDAIEWVTRSEHKEFREAVETLIGYKGSSTRFEQKFRAATEEYAATVSDDAEAKTKSARDLFFGSEPIRGTLAETYLKSRKIRPTILPSIRFAKALTHRESRTPFPALVAAVQDGAGKVCAVQRVYLAPDGSKKAAIDPPKMSLAPLRDGAVRLGKAGRMMGIAEGIETGLSAQQLYSIPVWVSLGTARMHQLAIPEQVTEIIIFADNGTPGRDAASRSADTYRRQGKLVSIEFPDPPYGDFNDLVRGAH